MVSDFLQLAETVAAVHTNATFCLGTTGANQSKTPIPSNKVLRHSIDVYQTKHAIGWNSSHDLFKPIACFVWYTSTLCRSTLLFSRQNAINQMYLKNLHIKFRRSKYDINMCTLIGGIYSGDFSDKFDCVLSRKQCVW